MGTNVVWTYLVTTAGTVPLTITSVTDDAGTANGTADDFRPRYVSGDRNNNGKLDRSEAWLFTSAGVFPYTVRTNLYGNRGSVTVTSNGETVTTTSDPSYHLGNSPTLFVQKAINAADPMNPTPVELAQAAPGRALTVGTKVVWTYKVYNTGDGPIQVTYLRDDAGTPSDPRDDFSPTRVLQTGFDFNLGDTDRDALLDTDEAWLYSSRGSGSGMATVPNWDRVYQDFLSATDTSGAAATPGFVRDPVGTPNTFSDNIFTGGGSKDTNDVGQWRWKTQQPQDKDDIADAFGASYADAATGHQLAFAGLDRYAANGNATVGFWFFQTPVAAVAGGTFSGGHTDGDLLLVLDFTVGGSTPVVQVYRWTGTGTSGTLKLLSAPAGSTFASVNSGPVSVPWAFIDKAGFTSPQAGEFLKVGVDLTALFGANVPRYASFLAETRSSNSITSTLSDFALGSVIAVQTQYTVKPGPYSNTVTALGKDPLTGATISATNTNYHFGVTTGPQLATSAPSPYAGATLSLTEAELAPIVAEAKARWASQGASPEVLTAFSIGIADLPDGRSPTLGYTADIVTLDTNAGGFGWFVDATPGDDAEFGDRIATSELRAFGDSPASGRMDLLTVVMHELGHVLGRADLGPEVEPHGLMAEALPSGTRRLPATIHPPAGTELVLHGTASTESYEFTTAAFAGGRRPLIASDRPVPSGIVPDSGAATSITEFTMGGSERGVAMSGTFPVMSTDRRFSVASVGANVRRIGGQSQFPDVSVPSLFPHSGVEADMRRPAAELARRMEDRYSRIASPAPLANVGYAVEPAAAIVTTVVPTERKDSLLVNGILAENLAELPAHGLFGWLGRFWKRGR